VESVKAVIRAARCRGSRMQDSLRRILSTFDSRGRQGETNP